MITPHGLAFALSAASILGGLYACFLLALDFGSVVVGLVRRLAILVRRTA